MAKNKMIYEMGEKLPFVEVLNRRPVRKSAEQAARALGWTDFYDTEDNQLIVASENSDVHYYSWTECCDHENISYK